MSETDDDTIRENIDAIMSVLKEALAEVERGQTVAVTRTVHCVVGSYEETDTITIEVKP